MGTYGQTFASELNQRGKHDEAIAAATDAMTKEPENPEHWFDRATAYEELGKHSEAATDLERAKELNVDADVLDEDEADDLYFTACLAAAKQEPVQAACERLDRYRKVWPEGRHVKDSVEWKQRLTGQLKSDWVKAKA